MGLQVRELPVGVEVVGPDLREELSPAQVDELRALFDTRHLVLFRGQDLAGDRQADVSGWFRPVVAEKAGRYGYVSNVRDGAVVPEGALPFHSDFAFTEDPLLGISLHALTVPADGAPTRFADAARVLALLPADLRDRIGSAHILNVYDFSLPTDRPMRDADLSPGSPRVELPFVRRHPVTGEAVVVANEMHTDRVLDLPAPESAGMLDEVLGVLYAPQYVYEHHWRVGDLVIWDNVAVHHGRHAFASARDGGEERTLQRVAMGTKSAHEIVPDLDELLARNRA